MGKKLAGFVVVVDFQQEGKTADLRKFGSLTNSAAVVFRAGSVSATKAG